MKTKPIELVLRKSDWKWTSSYGIAENWSIYKQDGTYVGAMLESEIIRLFNPGKETCLILEVKAYPAEWDRGDE